MSGSLSNHTLPTKKNLVRSLRSTIYIDASGARIVSNSSHAAEFKDIKDFFLKKLKATAPTTSPSPSPRKSATPARGKEATK